LLRDYVVWLFGFFEGAYFKLSDERSLDDQTITSSK
jgi:hypothetical protein